MTIEFLRQFLIWSLIVNYAVLFIWFFVIVFAKSWMRNLHGRWFSLSETTFDTVHYAAMAVYKVGILLFNLTPLVALWVLQAD